MDPKEYEAEDFLQDLSFCDFCLGNNEQAVNFWENWISLNPDRAVVFQQAKLLHSLLNGNLTAVQYKEDRQFFMEKMNAHLSLPDHPEPDVSAQPLQRSRVRKLTLYASAIAAAGLLFPILSPVFKPFFSATSPVPSAYGYIEDSKAGERKSFQLSDGTKVMLNAGSTIKVAKNFNISSREILLEGEAFFDVAHNAQKPFIIHTVSMDVKVLGTAFNIRAYPSDKTTETSLLNGSVEVTVKNDPGKAVILHPNEKIILPNNNVQENDPASPAPRARTLPAAKEKYKISGLTYSPMDSSLVEVCWTDNKLAFDSDSFEDIAVRLERWYNVSIHFENPAIRSYRFTAVFDKKTISQVLEALQLSRRFEYTEQEENGKEQIIIK